MYLGVGVALRAEYRVVFLAVKLLFGKTEQAGHAEGENEIDHADHKIGLEGLEVLALDNAREIVKLGDAYYVQHRRILYIDNEFVAYGGEYIAYDLREDDVEHCLAVAHADGGRTLELTFVDRNYAAADDLRHISTCVYRNDKYARRYERQGIAAAGEGVAPENDHCLNHHRCAAEDLNINGDYRVKYPAQHAEDGIARHRCRAEHAREQPDEKARDGAYKGYQHRDADPLEYEGVIFPEDVDHIVEKAHDYFFLYITTRLEV